jgi:hypothetical protein
LTQRKYDIAEATPFHTYAGVAVTPEPLGATSTGAAGGLPTVNPKPLLHGPAPSAFLACTQKTEPPGDSGCAGVTEHVVPSQMSAAEYHA